MTKAIIKIAKVIIGFPVYYISMIFPKKRNLSIIGSSLGKHFADNPKYFYIEYYNSLFLNGDKNLVWISKDKEVVKQLKSLSLPAEHLYSLKGVYTVLRASRAYISHQLTDINGALMGGAKIIQLWHAMALRKVGYRGDWSNENFSGKIKNFSSKWLPYTYYMKCDILIAPCEIAKENSIEPFCKSFRNNKIADNIILARQPRTLCFDDNFKLGNDFFPEKELLLSFTKKYNKIISWLPTQRRQLGKTIIDVISDSQLSLSDLNQFCKSKNFLFVIKAHFLDFDETSKIVQNLDFIFVYPHADPYPLLKYTDVLITDYSSVFFDFLFLNRPIIFMCYDLDEYREKVSFYYDYENLEMGLICKSWEEVMKGIINVSEDKDDYVYKRKEVFNDYNFVIDYNLKMITDIEFK